MTNMLSYIIQAEEIQPPAEPIPKMDPPFVFSSSFHLFRDLVYSEPDGKTLFLDLFAPMDAKRLHPGIVFIPGGGWSGGKRFQFWRQASLMAEKGFVSVIIEHRLAPEYHFPDPLNDVQEAIRWLRVHSKEYQVDPEKIAVVGGSSGGHLAALAASNLWDGKGWSGAPEDVRVQALVAFNPALDLSTRPDAQPRQDHLGVAYEKNPDLWSQASPIHHVSSQFAPALILHGTKDELVSYAESIAMVARLKEEGVRVEFFPAVDANHGFFNRPPWYKSTLNRMTEFLSFMTNTKNSEHMSMLAK